MKRQVVPGTNVRFWRRAGGSDFAQQPEGGRSQRGGLRLFALRQDRAADQRGVPDSVGRAFEAGFVGEDVVHHPAAPRRGLQIEIVVWTKLVALASQLQLRGANARRALV